MTWIYGEEKSFITLLWLSGWSHRKSHDIIGSPVGALTDYQIRFKAIYGYFYPELVATAPHSGYIAGVVYAVVGNYLYWGVNYGGGTTGYIYKTDLTTLTTITIYTGNYKAEWQGVKVGNYIYAVGEEKDAGGIFRSSIHIIDTTTDAVTAVRHPDTGDCNELIGVDTDGTIIVAGERVGGGGTTGSLYPNGGGVWRIPIATITDPSTWERTWEDPNHYGWNNIAYFNGKWYAILHSADSFGRWRVISSSDLYNWTTELDYTAQNVGVRSDPGLVKCGDKLVALAPVADTGTFHMFVFDGSSWIDHDLGISIPSENNGIVGLWNPSVNRLIIAIDYFTSVKHDIYSINVDGSGLITEKTNLSQMFSRPSSGAGSLLIYNGEIYYGGIAPSGGTGSFRRLKFADDGEMFFLQGKARSDFGDVRFTADDKVTELSYWTGEKVDGDYALFWVKIPNIPADPNAVTIYVYYGKPDAITTSNGLNTFVRFDDFEDYADGEAPKSERGWTTEGVDVNNYFKAAANPSGPGMVMKAVESGDGIHTILIMNIPEAGQYAIGYKIYCVDASFGEAFVDAYENSNLIAWHNMADGGSGTDVKWWDGAARQEFNPPLDIVYGSWNKFEARITLTDFHLILNDVDGDGGLASTPTNGINIWRIYHSRILDGIFFLDNFYIRKYVEPEPSHGSWGAEESI